MASIDNPLSIRIQAARIRKQLLARHPEGTAVRRMLANMSDEKLVALDKHNHEQVLKASKSEGQQ